MSALSLPDAIAGYFTARSPRKDSTHTLRAYRNDLARVSEVIAAQLGRPAEQIAVDALTLPVMRAAFDVYARQRASATVLRAHSVWTTLFDYLVSEDHVGGNPMPGVAKPKPPRRQPKPFEQDDAERIVRAVLDEAIPRRDPWPELDRAVVLLTMVTGARSAEVRALDIGDLVGEPGNHRVRVRGKGDADRQVPVEPPIVTVLGEYLDSRRRRFTEGQRQRGLPDSPTPFQQWRPEAPMFVNRRGERMTEGALYYLVRTVYRAAGVDAVRAQGAMVHALRHTAATRLAENGATAVEIMRVLGHQSIATSQAYVDATARDVRRAAATSPVYGLLDSVDSER